MSKPAQAAQLKALAGITGMVLEARLAELRRANAACEATRAALVALSATQPAPESDLPLAALARADLLYDRWVEGKRADLNLQLARQTATWLDSRSVAAKAFGRDEVLKRLTEQLDHERAKLRAPG